jgi:rhodanese-related sulfurtransferase
LWTASFPQAGESLDASNKGNGFFIIKEEKMKRTTRNKLFLTCMLLAASLFALSGFTHAAQQEGSVKETEALLNFFENERDYFHKGGPFVITAQALRLNMLTKPQSQYLIDIRSPEAFAKAHIRGAHHVDFADVYKHVKQLNASSYENIVVMCFAGQASAYAVSLLRAAGYANAVSLKWGTSSWASVFAQESWLRNLSSVRTDEFVQTPSPPKNPPGELPKLNTGKTKPEEILEARLDTLFAEGFRPIMVSHCCLFNSWYCNSDYYVVNYWPTELYEKIGHIPGAVNYPPKEQPFRSSNHLLTLSTKNPNVLYCYTGQTSAYTSGYLRLLGYDARSLLFGANSIIYDRMRDNKVENTFIPETEIMNYDYVSGN